MDDILQMKRKIDFEEVGEAMYRLIKNLYPICRSITGDGVRKTLAIFKEYIPLAIHEVPSGTSVFDWSVPDEWNIRDAYIKDSNGNRIVNFKKSNLHVLNYSIPVNKTVPLHQLKKNLFTDPEHPEWIPYRTSYYKKDWGFCLSQDQFLELKEGEYEVLIDSSLEPGHLTFGEYVVKGQKSDEVLISCHICHPSLCNDNLSGMALAVFLARELSHLSLRYTYRFLFIPGTIGSITWLCLNEKHVSKIKYGLVAACVGDGGNFTYKKTRRGDTEIDSAVINVLMSSGHDYKIIDFFPYGYDERQYCSPGFNLPVGCLMRTPFGEYPEYHTSADNLDFVRPEYLAESFATSVSALSVLECNKKYINLNPKCEPQLGKRGLYDKIGGQSDSKVKQLAILWVLNLSDGNNTLLDISNRSGVEFDIIKDVADTLVDHGLLSAATG
jgi:aminopeptidase-like protein